MQHVHTHLPLPVSPAERLRQAERRHRRAFALYFVALVFIVAGGLHSCTAGFLGLGLAAVAILMMESAREDMTRQLREEGGAA